MEKPTMIKVNQFWQDVDFAIATLLLRQSIRQTIIENRNNKPEIKKSISSAKNRDRVLNHYHLVTMTRFHDNNMHMSNSGV